MILLLLFMSLTFCQNTDFIVVGLSTNMSIIYTEENIYDFNSFQLIICNLLANTTANYIGLFPINNIKSCPKLPPNFKVNIINSILDTEMKKLSSSSCYTIGDCIMNNCQNFLSSKESFLMVFTGQCL